MADVEVVKADPRARRLAVAAILVITIAGVGLLYRTTQRVEELHTLAAVDAGAALREATRLLWIVAAMAAVAAAVVAAGVARMSVAIRRTGRYPVAGAWLLRDTPVRTGARARRVAVFARAVAVILALAGVAVLVSAWRVSRLLAQ